MPENEEIRSEIHLMTVHTQPIHRRTRYAILLGQDAYSECRISTGSCQEQIEERTQRWPEIEADQLLIHLWVAI